MLYVSDAITDVMQETPVSMGEGVRVMFVSMGEGVRVMFVSMGKGVRVMCVSMGEGDVCKYG